MYLYIVISNVFNFFFFFRSRISIAAASNYAAREASAEIKSLRCSLVDRRVQTETLIRVFVVEIVGRTPLEIKIH